MRKVIIKKICIKNFGSLSDILLDDLGNFIVLLGKNGVGKSFLLEALHHFFSEFKATGGESSISKNDYLWHGRMTEEPIRLGLTFQLTDNEVKKVFSLPEKIFSNVKKTRPKELFKQVEISRILIFGGNWETESIKWADIKIVEDDKLVDSGPLAELVKVVERLENYQFGFFTPEHSAENIGGDRLLLDIANKVAYYSNNEIDSLVSKGIIESQKTYSTPEFQQVSDWRVWASNTGYTVVERPPNVDETPKVFESIAALSESSSLDQIVTKLTQLIRGKFKFVQSARDAQATVGVRQPFIAQDALNALKTLSLSRTRHDEIKWQKYRSGVEQLIYKALEPSPEQLLIRDGDLGLPAAYTGGGEQTVLTFQWWFLDTKDIFAIEEPENHLHPELSRQIFKFLKQQSQNHQVFISTHSPMFADKKDITNNWVMTLIRPREGEYGESKIQQIETRDDLKLALAELGVLPSDIYLKDFVVFVEGGTEKEAVLPILGSKLGVNMEDNIGVLAIGGEKKLEGYLRVWLEIMQYAPADYLVILDKHGSELALRLAREMHIESAKFRVWKKGSIEDYYPLDIAIKALKNLFGVEVSKSDIHKNKPLDKELKRILESKGKICKGWKVEIGTYVSQRMEVKDIPKEIKDVCKYIKERTEI